MKIIPFLIMVIIAGCNAGDQQSTKETKTHTSIKEDSANFEKQEDTILAPETDVREPDNSKSSKTYSNERFKEVTVTKTGNEEFLIKGKAQIFEASFSWAVEDGHEELKQGYNTTDAGAPAWGNFSFSIDVPKKRANSTLHLILFELSAKDGSRQHQLLIPLY